jgi:hypothetical protein
MRASRTICSILFCLMYPCPPQICIQPRALVNCARACTPAGRCGPTALWAATPHGAEAGEEVQAALGLGRRR